MSRYTCATVAVILVSSSSVGAVLLLNTCSVPSPKSQVNSNSSMPSGGLNVARNLTDCPVLTVWSSPESTTMSTGASRRLTDTREKAEVVSRNLIRPARRSISS